MMLIKPIFRGWMHLSFCVFSVLLCFGCGSFNDGKTTAQVLKMKPLESHQSPSAAPTYVLEAGTFEFMDHFENLSGEYYRMVQGGIVDVTSQNGSIDSVVSFSGGETPKLHYEVKNGVVIPKDYDTLVMLSSLYHFDTVLSHLKEISGIDPSSLNLAQKKIEIFFEPTVLQNNKRMVGKLNAACLPMAEQFLLFRRSELEHLPLAGNLQVIAHEFGHLVFDQVLFDHKKNDSKYYDSFVLKGLNEGFADFFSYTLTGSTDILVNSFNSSLFNAAERNFSVINFKYSDLTPSTERFPQYSQRLCSGSFYCIGSVFARSLFDAQKALNINTKDRTERGRFLTEVIQAFSKMSIAESLMPNELRKSNLLKPTPFDVGNDLDGKSLSTFFETFTSHISSKEMRVSICNSIRAHFNQNQRFNSKLSECE